MNEEYDWLIVQLNHNIEMLEQDIEDEGLFGNNYALGKLAAYKDVLNAITEVSATTSDIDEVHGLFYTWKAKRL